MACVLRISGISLDIDVLLSRCALAVNSVWRKGTSRVAGGKVHSTSGLCIVVSEADLDAFNAQVSDAILFLRNHLNEISEMAAIEGVDHAYLDFGVSIYRDAVAKYCKLPLDLVRLAAGAGLSLEVSYYKCSDESESAG